MSKKIIPSSPEEREVEYENLEIFGFGISSFKYLLLSDLKSTKYAKQTEIRLLENNIGNLDGMRQNEGTTRHVFILSESSSCSVFNK